MDAFESLARDLAGLGRELYARGWVLGTSGNFSAIVSRTPPPTRLAITTSGVDKGLLEAHHIVEIDEDGRVLRGSGTPSAETALHLAVARTRGAGAGAVLHTHSIWSTILSGEATDGALTIDGYEMLKGLENVRTHQHRESLPVLDNTQDWERAVPLVERALRDRPEAHGFLIRGHGLYTWGRDLSEAKRHVEILEFLLEAEGRKRGMSWQP